MSREERRRLIVFGRVKEGRSTVAEAGRTLGVSGRQAKRLWARFLAEGDAGLVHRARGRPSNRKKGADFRNRVVQLCAEHFPGYGPTLAAECLAEEHQVQVPATTLRRWLSVAGVWTRVRKRKAHRSRRPRRPRKGELVQMDGSRHAWFDDRRGHATLMVAVDDATGAVYARFFEEETLAAAFETFDRWTRLFGVPEAVYVDQASIYRTDREPTDEEVLAEASPTTQFGRAMDELDVRLILARSPQAKGRVERMNGTLQDRLAKALRRATIDDLEAANRFLEDVFLPRFNAKFLVPPSDAEDASRPRPAEPEMQRILSVAEVRTVQNDWTIRWNNGFLQLPRSTAGVVRPQSQVEVREHYSGASKSSGGGPPAASRLRVFFEGEELPWTTTRSEPTAARERPRGSTGGSSQGLKPAADHPWRKPFVERSRPLRTCSRGSRSAAVGLGRSGSGSRRSPAPSRPRPTPPPEPPTSS